MPMQRSHGLLAVAIIFAMSFTPIHSTASQSQFYFSLKCLSKIEDQDSCNATFLNKSINIRFSNGRTDRIRYDYIKSWRFVDKESSRLNEEMVIGFGGPTGLIVGALFRKAQHQFTFTIVYDNGFGDEEVVMLNFSDQKYVQPVFDQLRQKAGAVEVSQKS
jgi:hypothetical protein